MISCFHKPSCTCATCPISPTLFLPTLSLPDAFSTRQATRLLPLLFPPPPAVESKRLLRPNPLKLRRDCIEAPAALQWSASGVIGAPPRFQWSFIGAAMERGRSCDGASPGLQWSVVVATMKLRRRRILFCAWCCDRHGCNGAGRCSRSAARRCSGRWRLSQMRCSARRRLRCHDRCCVALVEP